jgi:hypothetical protein
MVEDVDRVGEIDPMFADVDSILFFVPFELHSSPIRHRIDICIDALVPLRCEKLPGTRRRQRRATRHYAIGMRGDWAWGDLTGRREVGR